MSVRSRLFLAVLVATVVAAFVTWVVLNLRVTRRIEEEVGLQMAVQAEIAARLVKVAEGNGMTPDQINQELQAIASSVANNLEGGGPRRKYEFWITDGDGKSYLRSEPNSFDFDISSEQASAFLPLLADSENRGYGPHRHVVIQEARPRTIDPLIYKYVGVAGADKSRIVQVGYGFPLLASIQGVSRDTALIVALIQCLCGSALLLFAFRQVTSPIAKLQRVLKQLDKQDGKYDIKELARLLQRRDEVGQLATVVDEFSKSVIQNRRELAKLQADAEAQRRVFIGIQDGVIIECNKVAEEVFKFTRSELIGQQIDIIVPDVARQEVHSALDGVRSEQVTANFNENRTKHNEARWIFWQNMAVRGAGARNVHCFGTDLSGLLQPDGATEQRTAEVLRFARAVVTRQAQESEAARKREEAVQNMRVFLSNTAHELRRPLHAIRGYTHLLLGTGLTMTQAQDLKIIDGQARLLRSNIESLLDIAAIEQGRLQLESKPFSLRAAVEDVTAGLALFAEEKGLALVCRVDPALPATFVGDAVRVGQIVANLVNNAIQYTATGEVLVEVLVEPHENQLRARVVGRVRDTGVGIAKDRWEVVFQPHEQVRVAAGRGGDGLGLGLTICRGLVEKMRGNIAVEASTPGSGTTIRFTLELERPPQSNPVPGEQAALPSAAGRHALLADIHPIRRQAMADLLLSWGMRVTQVDGVEGAAAALLKGSVDVLLLHAGKGHELIDAERVRVEAAGDSTPIILLVAPSRAIDPDACARLGVRAAIHQPATRSETLAALGAIWNVPATHGSAHASRTSLRILVVDDHATDRELHRRLLEARGHAVTTARNGQEAVDAIQKGVTQGLLPNLVLLDVKLPDFDGLTVASRIRALVPSRKQLRIVAVSANTPSAAPEIAEWHARGADACFRKSEDVDALLDAAERAATLT